MAGPLERGWRHSIRGGRPQAQRHSARGWRPGKGSAPLRQNDGAQERTRTFTAVKPLAPEASASTNSATWARSVGSREPASLKPRLTPVNGPTQEAWARRIAAAGGIVYPPAHRGPRHRLPRVPLYPPPPPAAPPPSPPAAS